ncbi:ATP-binding protein [Acinetobacter bereziniae]|uniref:ATP-binding protein n=1 Tax=Acinetobacter bereziniae TaxID=106648 RepID=UPI0021D14541|nr:ATP-binding protein [Acinetobacter bereziniae]MCU4316649.1 ATP-binding protein [Acinetobacter bereziniae]
MFFRVNEFNFGDFEVILSTQNKRLPDNAISIITGKNAVGKSRLLSNIIAFYIKKIKDTKDNDLNSQYYDSNNKPSNIIVITNNSADRFPQKYEKDTFYEYFGNKTKLRATINDKYEIFRKIILHEKPNTDCLKSTLSYLNFQPYFSITFTSNIKLTAQNFQINNFIDLYYKYNDFIKNTVYISNKSKSLLSSFDPENPIENQKVFQSLTISEKYFFLILKHLSKDGKNIKKIKFEIIFEFIDSLISNNLSKIQRHFDIDNLGVKESFDDLKYLLNHDIIKISNVNFKPSHSKYQIEFYNLSSGQQSLLKIFLGISSCIDHNSLICIDEPEVNLHPEWQTEFILKLQELFKTYFGCHFLIATHSPQIVSGLSSPNGFIVDLENNDTHESIKYSKKSADYQLAKIFNAPGYNNEYIIKICLLIISKVKNKSKFDESDINIINELKGFQKLLKIDDPVYYLVKEVLSLYGEINE